jgi:hypothetical protein
VLLKCDAVPQYWGKAGVRRRNFLLTVLVSGFLETHQRVSHVSSGAGDSKNRS